jgi:hypothetical protein
MTAALVAAIGWIVTLELTIRRLKHRLEKHDQRLRSAKLTLSQAKEAVEAATHENQFLKTVIHDVATGDAHVWIEDGEVRATRTAAGETPIH